MCYEYCINLVVFGGYVEGIFDRYQCALCSVTALVSVYALLNVMLTLQSDQQLVWA